jgi:hypothetical protein
MRVAMSAIHTCLTANPGNMGKAFFRAEDAMPESAGGSAKSQISAAKATPS